MASTRCLNYIYCKLFSLKRARANRVILCARLLFLCLASHSVILMWLQNVCFWSIWRGGHKVMNLNVYRFMLKLFFMSYTSFCFYFCISDSVFIFLFVAQTLRCYGFDSFFRFFCGTLFCHYIIVIVARTHQHVSMHRCMWMNESNNGSAAEKKKKSVNIKMKLKFRTEKYFVRLNGRQGVAERKKQMNVCKYVEMKFI